MDVYRREVPAQRRLGSFGLYVASFPQLVTGPIVRYHDVAAEIDQRVMGGELFVSGIRRFIVGLAKKMLIAYPLGEAADQIFALPGEELGTATAWLGIVCYTLQIYFDFSAYSDMAIGLGRMLGFRFLENFNYPYIARSIQSIRSGFRRLSRPGLSSLAREAGASRAGLRSWSFVTREEKPERHFRDVATRYDKLDCRYEAFIAAASMLIWLA